MNIHIDTTVLYNPVLYYVVYGVGLFVAANIAAVKYKRRKPSSDDIDYALQAVFWPVLLVWNLFLLPSRFFK